MLAARGAVPVRAGNHGKTNAAQMKSMVAPIADDGRGGTGSKTTTALGAGRGFQKNLTGAEELGGRSWRVCSSLHNGCFTSTARSSRKSGVHESGTESFGLQSVHEEAIDGRTDFEHGRSWLRVR